MGTNVFGAFATIQAFYPLLKVCAVSLQCGITATLKHDLLMLGKLLMRPTGKSCPTWCVRKQFRKFHVRIFTARSMLTRADGVFTSAPGVWKRLIMSTIQQLAFDWIALPALTRMLTRNLTQTLFTAEEGGRREGGGDAELAGRPDGTRVGGRPRPGQTLRAVRPPTAGVQGQQDRAHTRWAHMMQPPSHPPSSQPTHS